MKIFASLAKIPWKNLLRLLPGVLGIAGELMSAQRESAQTDRLKRIEERLDSAIEAVSVLEKRIRLVFWISGAAFTVAAAALLIALIR